VPSNMTSLMLPKWYEISCLTFFVSAPQKNLLQKQMKIICRQQ
jgi:hypothetical protein